ncbi:MAG TPA: HEAT repeat domain-containing protein, partial [Candidatus Limnocylindria bacterium]|nr:HEAT repeat domain-containing protein [Candidatus Limnocylindria bacterium]
IEPGQKPNDKVLILEDSNADGVADKTTVFADGLMIPTGLEVAENGCYVGHGTELLLLKDNDGDGKADERRVVLRGFGTGDNHQNINSFMWGDGGQLFMCQGLHIHSHVETPWGISSLEQAGVWRLRPRLLRLDGFFGSANEPQNPWGWVFTDWGEPIVIAGNNSSHIYPVPGMVVNHRDEPPPLIWKNGNGRKCSNGDIVGTTHFPDEWQGALIVGGYLNNAVWGLRIKDDGAGFALEDLPPLIRSKSTSFRPVDARFGPDGALYIADWYNPIIGHYQASFRHPDRDKTHGRIWRVTAKGRALTKPPQLADATLVQLLDALKSPDRWTRHFAKRVLAEKPTEQVVAALKNWMVAPVALRPDRLAARGDPPSEHALKEALGVYQSHEVVAPELLGPLCAAKDANARAYAASVVGAWAGKVPNALDLLRPLVVDDNARVRLQAIVACTYVTNSHAMEVVASAADFPTDKFLDLALKQAVFALKPYWLPALRTGQLNFEGKPARISMLVRADGTSDVLQSLRALLQSPQTDVSARETYWRIMADVGDANDLAALLRMEDASLQARVLPVLVAAAKVRTTRPAGDLAALLKLLLGSSDESIRAQAFRLVGEWKIEPLGSAVETSVANTRESEEVRAAAVEALGRLPNARSGSLLSQLATNDTAPRVQAAAIAAWSLTDATEAGKAAARAFARFEDEAAVTQIFTAFLQRQHGGEALAAALESSAPSARAADVGLRILSASGRREEQLARVLARAAGLSSHNSGMTAPEIATLVQEVKTRGEARRGAEIFQRPQLGCVACHAVNGQGGSIGPNLSALGTAQPIDFIIGAILDPQKEIKEGYTSISVTTKDGEEYQGYQVRENKDEVVLRDVLQNKEVRLRRATIQEKRQNGSVMPAGLVDTLTREEFRDLIRYLSELGRTR